MFWPLTVAAIAETAALKRHEQNLNFFGTFGIVGSLTQGGPGQATNILVWKVYNDGFRGQDLGGSSAQSVILMIVVIALTFVQFRFIERRVNYSARSRSASVPPEDPPVV